MARLHALLILGAIASGTAAWLLLSRGDDIAPPMAVEPQAHAPHMPSGGETEQPARASVSSAMPASAAAQPVPPPAIDAPEPTTADPPATTVLLLASDLAHKQPLPQFRWSFQPRDPQPDGGAPLRGRGELGRAALPLPPMAIGRLLVEADGLDAHTENLSVPALHQPPLRLDVYLAPHAIEAGVVLTARDPHGLPVTRLRIDLWRRPADAQSLAIGDDPEGEPMWKRSGNADDGVFTLPTLAAGHYALRAQPVALDDVALPLQPWRREFAFAGNEAVPFQVDFVPGVVLDLTADLGVELQLTAIVSTRAGSMPVLWRSVAHSGRTTVGIDTLLLPGRATTLLALPPDAYGVVLRSGDQPVPLQPAAAADGVRAFRATLPR